MPQRSANFISVAGVDHAGIGLDFDGGGGVTGLNEASDYPRITERLLAAGYTRADLQKIWSGNALRVLEQAQEAAVLPGPVASVVNRNHTSIGAVARPQPGLV